MKILSKLFPKKYYLIFTKVVSTSYSNGQKGKTNHVITVLYRKKDKEGNRKFFIDHDIRTAHLVTWFTAKWWMFLIQVYGKKSKRLFAYKLPTGTVFLRKADV